MEHDNQAISSPRNAEQHEMDSTMVWQQRQKKSSKQPKQSTQLNPTLNSPKPTQVQTTTLSR